jgi:hypothetical protein
VKRDRGAGFAVREAARAEFAYWEVHRDQAGRQEREPVVAALAAIPAAVYGVPRVATLASARERDHAVVLVDHVTGKRRAPTEEAWQEIEEALQRSYESLAAVLARRRTAHG